MISQAESQIKAIYPAMGGITLIDDEKKRFKTVIAICSRDIGTAIVRRFIDSQYTALHKEFTRKVTVDDFGIEDHDQWNNSISHIVLNRLLSEFQFELTTLYKALPFMKYVPDEDDEVVSLCMLLELNFKQEYESRKSALEIVKLDFEDDMDGIDYEIAIADLINLNLADWNASVSKASGDQGVDVQARSSWGTLIAIQCKRYNSPVGNKAVQEVHSGKSFYSADQAVVVTNSSYTKSAYALAKSLNVELLHHDSLVEYLSSLKQIDLHH